jgi:hypothetical protein
VLPNKLGGEFDSHCVAIAQGDSSGIVNAEANARRLAACWNACQRFDVDLLERISRPGNLGFHPAPQEKIDDLLETLKFIRNHSSVNPHQIEVIDSAIAKITGSKP